MNRSAGYTLLEMVVVLALLGLATAMVAPASFRMIQSWRDAGEVGQVLGQLAALPTLARSQGSVIRIDPPASAATTAPSLSPVAAVPLPEGWRLDMDQPLVVRPNGACSDATGALVTRRQTIRFRVDAPFCHVTRLPADGA